MGHDQLPQGLTFVSCTPIAARLSLGARMTAAQRSLITPTFCGACSASACNHSLLCLGLGTAMSRPMLCVIWFGRHGQDSLSAFACQESGAALATILWAFSRHA